MCRYWCKKMFSNFFFGKIIRRDEMKMRALPMVFQKRTDQDTHHKTFCEYVKKRAAGLAYAVLKVVNSSIVNRIKKKNWSRKVKKRKVPTRIRTRDKQICNLAF